MMGSIFGDNLHCQVFVSLVLIGTIVSSSFSILMLILIKRMNLWNEYIFLITMMAAFQLVYDITFFPGVVNVGDKYLTIIANTLQLFSGVVSSLLSNVVAGITFYVIYFKLTLSVFNNFLIFLSIVIIPALIDCVIYLVSLQGRNSKIYSDIAVIYFYYYLKLVSIGLNFFLVALISYEIRRTGSGKQRKSLSETSMSALSLRLFLYPLVQSVSRVGCAWYEWEYQYNSHDSNGFDLNPPTTTDRQFAAQIVMALTMPLASIGYLIIFLLMQPKACNQFWRLFGLSENYPPKLDPHNEERREEEEEKSMKSLVSFSSESNLRFSLLEGDFF